VFLAGDDLFFIGAANNAVMEITPAVLSRRLEALGSPARTILPQTLSLLFDAERLADLRHRFSGQAGRINTDARPLMVGMQTWFWLAVHAGPMLILVLLGLTGLAGLLVQRAFHSQAAADFWLLGLAGGLALALEWFVIAACQSCRGDVWREIGLLFAAYMAGSGTGAALGAKLNPRIFKSISVILLAALSAGAGWLVFASQGLPLVSGTCLFLTGAGAGLLYALVCRNQDSRFAARAWGADCLGSTGGALLAGLILLPLMGIWAGMIPALLLLGFFIMFIFPVRFAGKPAR
jgi:hypothetical protein